MSLHGLVSGASRSETVGCSSERPPRRYRRALVVLVEGCQVPLTDPPLSPWFFSYVRCSSETAIKRHSCRNNVSGRHGFDKNASAPALRACASSAVHAQTVSATIGMPRVDVALQPLNQLIAIVRTWK